MRFRSLYLGVAALAVCAGFAVPALARSTDSFQVNVTATDSSCKLAVNAVSAANTRIIFHVVNNGHRKHGFTVSRKSTPLLAPKGETSLIVNFGKSGRWAYACTGGTTSHMRGWFTIRNK
jgi:plastocyanin